MAGGAQISGSSVGDIAGVVLRDNMFTVQRPDIAVPTEVRREELTRRFLDGLRELSSSGECVVLFFDAVEKMSESTHQWLWEQLLPTVRDALPNVRAVLCGQRPPPQERDWDTDYLAVAELKPLGLDDIEAYIAKRAAGKVEMLDETRQALATMLAAVTKGRPADVASAVDLYLASSQSSRLMTGPTPDALAAFQQLLEGTGPQGEAERPVVLTDALVGQELGAVLRRCAVPHEFDRRLLEQLGGFSAAEAEQHFQEFCELSIMQFTGDALSVHERWRKPLWSWWLEDEQRAEFVALNESLVEWFGAGALATGSETDERRQMFHLVGCRQDEGLRMFEELCRRGRHRRSFPECRLLIRLVSEYEPLLSASERAVIDYHDGKLASDLRDWERALGLFHGVAAEPDADTELQVIALVREGHALRELGRADEALAVLEDARRRSTGEAASELAWRALYELGEIYRDLGQADLADRTLREALEQALKAGDRSDVAGVLNSLGTVQRKLRDVDAAIDSFRKSLEELARRGDVVRPGAVFNNLGMAQMDKLEWDAAEASFFASLECKRAAGDQLGQANTLLNLSRAQLAQDKLALAEESAVEAGTLYEAAGDGRGHARALLTQGRLAKRARQTDAARGLFQQAFERAAAAGAADLAGRARDEIARA